MIDWPTTAMTLGIVEEEEEVVIVRTRCRSPCYQPPSDSQALVSVVQSSRSCDSREWRPLGQGGRVGMRQEGLEGRFGRALEVGASGRRED